MRKRYLVVPLVAVLAVLLWGRADDNAPSGDEAAKAPATTRATSPARRPGPPQPDCGERLTALDAKRDPESAERARQGLAWSRGQAYAAAGAPVPFPADAGAESPQALASTVAQLLPQGMTLENMDCAEYPCILEFRADSDLDFDPFQQAMMQATGLSWAGSGGDHAGDQRTYTLALHDPKRGPRPHDRVLFRMRQQGEEAAPHMPIVPEPPTLRDDPCGPHFSQLRLEAELEQHQRRRDEALAAYYREVVTFMEGTASDFPSDLEPGFLPDNIEETAARILDPMGLAITRLDCDEYPCILTASAHGAATTDELIRRLVEVIDATWGLDAITPAAHVHEDTLNVELHLHGGHASHDSTRTWERARELNLRGYDMELPTTERDWSKRVEVDAPGELREP